MLFEELKEEELTQNYLNLLEQLTTVGSINLDDLKQHFRLINSNPLHKVYVLKLNDGTIVATGTTLIEPKFIHGLSYVGHIEDIVADKNHRGKGYGKLMMKNLLKVCEEHKCYKVILDCKESNVGFYVKSGFIANGVEMRYNLV